MRFKCAVSILLLSLSGYAHAGPYADQLIKCLIDSTTPADRAALVRWMFAAIAASPAVAPIAKVSPQVIDQVNAAAGSMYMKLLTESCRDKAKDALAHEGPATLELGGGQAGAVKSFSERSPTTVKPPCGTSRRFMIAVPVAIITGALPGY